MLGSWRGGEKSKNVMVVTRKLMKKVKKVEWLTFKMNLFHPEDNRTVFH